MKALNFCKEVHDFQGLDFFGETDLNRSTAKKIYSTYFDLSKRYTSLIIFSTVLE